jgi:hypothetical protein
VTLRHAAHVTALAVAVSLALAAPAPAHVLSVPRAQVVAERYARDLAIRTFDARDRGSGVVGCRRLNLHSLRCQFFTAGLSLPPDPAAVRCDDAVIVYFATARSQTVLTRSSGLPVCRLS